MFAFNGKYTQVRYVNIWPQPLQKPHPPVWIPGGGSVETWEWTAKLDYVYCYLSRSEEHTSELQSRLHLVCRLLLEKKKTSAGHTSKRVPVSPLGPDLA